MRATPPPPSPPHAAQASLVQPGDIIVTHYTSPAWTPLLSLARAIVLEEGGILSHGAVVARECGIPAVASVRGVTASVRSGDSLYVDGATGEVRVLSR
jgi:phosphoenolpyruvate synthase/pyruvate phosphate dikinase